MYMYSVTDLYHFQRLACKRLHTVPAKQNPDGGRVLRGGSGRRPPRSRRGLGRRCQPGLRASARLNDQRELRILAQLKRVVFWAYFLGPPGVQNSAAECAGGLIG